MCGIFGGITQKPIATRLVEGLAILEYRGYDSAGLVTLSSSNDWHLLRVKGPVLALQQELQQHSQTSCIGMAHTRWATHGLPSKENAHPHMSGNDLALVHNGVIENHQNLRVELKEKGYIFKSETDSEVVAHAIAWQCSQGMSNIEALFAVKKLLKGSYAIAVMFKSEPDSIYALAEGSPLVVGQGVNDGEFYFASDNLALEPFCKAIRSLSSGDCVRISKNSGIDCFKKPLEGFEIQLRPIKTTSEVVSKGQFDHFMEKEMMEQSACLSRLFANRLGASSLNELMGLEEKLIDSKTQALHIVACGTSYHAGMVAKYWLESMAGISVSVEIASEYRYRTPFVLPGTIYLAISQSGETADLLAATRFASTLGYDSLLAICNVPGSALVQLVDGVLFTQAGREIAVASTKAFTSQLGALAMLTLSLAKQRSFSDVKAFEHGLRCLPIYIEQVTSHIQNDVNKAAELLTDSAHALYLGRGLHYPIACEGALKLKEIAYVHAEAYAGGELKHGPLALVDKVMPIVALLPPDDLLLKMKSNLSEVSARGGCLIGIGDESIRDSFDFAAFISLPSVPIEVLPFVSTIPLQWLSYKTAVYKGTDCDKPRNLAKSVTVE